MTDKRGICSRIVARGGLVALLLKLCVLKLLALRGSRGEDGARTREESAERDVVHGAEGGGSAAVRCGAVLLVVVVVVAAQQRAEVGVVIVVGGVFVAPAAPMLVLRVGCDKGKLAFAFLAAVVRDARDARVLWVSVAHDGALVAFVWRRVAGQTSDRVLDEISLVSVELSDDVIELHTLALVVGP